MLDFSSEVLSHEEAHMRRPLKLDDLLLLYQGLVFPNTDRGDEKRYQGRYDPDGAVTEVALYIVEKMSLDFVNDSLKGAEDITAALEHYSGVFDEFRMVLRDEYGFNIPQFTYYLKRVRYELFLGWAKLARREVRNKYQLSRPK
jgi:hypothetical protein